ncbi:MAG TPA: YlxR family protein [Bacilli bacterium]|nr:YlxR family protein [Bacilli bacterium]HQO93660.1 YlxR family protein [Bacilli bacterium]
MKVRKEPIRKCLATGMRFSKKDLVRIVRTPEGEIKIDQTGKLNGRGAYLSKSLEAIKLAKTKNIIGKALETEIPDNIYEQLFQLVGDKDGKN